MRNSIDSIITSNTLKDTDFEQNEQLHNCIIISFFFLQTGLLAMRFHQKETNVYYVLHIAKIIKRIQQNNSKTMYNELQWKYARLASI